MNNIKTVDVKGLEHMQREQMIFPAIEDMKTGDILKISVEFNPVPLTYMLKANGEFEISYEKEGPPEWLLNVKRIKSNDDNKKNLKQLLTEMKNGEISSETKEKAKKIFETVDAKSLGLVEQEIIREGVSPEEIRKSLCNIHLEVLRDSLVSKRMEVKAPHPINTFMEEHIVILDSLKELKALIEILKNTENFESFDQNIEKLKDIAHHLVEAESHHQREEEVIFTRLEKHNIVEPVSIMKIDHAEFRNRKQELYNLSHNWQKIKFEDFKKRITELGEYLTEELESHIFKEDNILYQIALQTFDEKEWEKVKKECDNIGYCCFTPADQKNIEKG